MIEVDMIILIQINNSPPGRRGLKGAFLWPFRNIA
jgi:hypothetical protein